MTHHRVLQGTYQWCQEVWFGSEAFLVNCQLRPTWERCGAGNTSAGMTRIWSKKRIITFMRVPCQPGAREIIFVTFCEKEGMKVSNIFIILQNNEVWWGLNCKCVILTSANRRKKQRRNGNLYIYLHMYLNIYSQSVTFRHAHLAAAVSGNLWKSHWSRSGHTNRVKLQVAWVPPVIQCYSGTFLMHFNFTHKELTHGRNLQGKNIGGYEQNQLKLKGGNSDLWKSEWHFPKHIMSTVSGGSPHINNVSKWQLLWGNWRETEAHRWLAGTLILQST